MADQRRKFPREFKVEAVRRVIDGGEPALVIETRGERFQRIAVQLAHGQDTNALAHEITRSIPDSGPVD